MIADSAKKTFQGVLVYQLDRFARNRYDSATYKAKLKKNGVRVLSARENISDDASGVLMEAVLEGIASLEAQAAELVIVTNEIFSDGIEYDEETRRYQSYLGEINRETARRACQVTEVVYGIPLIYKSRTDKEDRMGETDHETE